MAGGWTPGAAAAGGLGSKPQFATFETGPNGMAVDPALKRSVNEDALPPMPSWEGAAKKRISVEDEPNAVPLQQLDPATGQQMPLMSGAAGNISRAASPNAVPLSPYGEQQSGFIPNGPPTGAGYGAGAGALAGGAVMAGAVGGRGRPHDPYRQDSQSTRGGYNDRDPYSQQNGGYGAGRGNGYPPPQDEPYNPSFPNSNQQQNGYDNPYSPNPMNNQGYNDGSRSPGYNDYNTGGVGYASSNPSHTPRPYNERAYSDNRPQMPAGPLSNPSYGERNDGYGEPMRSHTASPPMLSNTSGYQQQGYGAPQRTYTGSTAPPSYVSRAPTMNNQGPQGYGGTRY